MKDNKSLRHAKRVIVGVIGSTVLLIGLVMLVLPGPGFIIIIAGLGLLATEFVWAKNLLEKTKHHYHKAKHKITNLGSQEDTNKSQVIEGSKVNYGNSQ